MLFSQPDIELWDAFIKGDKNSYSELFTRFYPLLFRYGVKIVADKEILEDAIQEVFLDLWNRKPQQRIHSVKAYLLQALKFTLYKSFRSDRKATLDENDDGHGFELSPETVFIGLEDQRQQTIRILDALSELSPRQREVIYLKIYQNLSYDEVSEVMQLNYQVVRNLLSNALKALRKFYVLALIPLLMAAL